jgi:glucose/arabinose dehydrogenase
METKMRLRRSMMIPFLIVGGCTAASETPAANNLSAVQDQAGALPFEVQSLGRFDEPWAMNFLPNGILLISEKRGRLRFLDLSPTTPRLGSIAGVPSVDYGGQGGFGDVVPHPDFNRNNLLYLSYVEAGDGGNRGAVVARSRLVLDEADAGRLEEVQIIWRQSPKMSGRGHFGHRIAFSPDGRHLFISSGERQEFNPAQDMNANLGKVFRATIPSQAAAE